MLWSRNGPGREASDGALPRLQDEFRHVRGRFHHHQATTTAPRAVRCHSRSVPGEPSSLTPRHDSTPASLMLAPFGCNTEGCIRTGWRLMFFPLLQHSVRRGSRPGTRTTRMRTLSAHKLPHPFDARSSRSHGAQRPRIRRGEGRKPRSLGQGRNITCRWPWQAIPCTPSATTERREGACNVAPAATQPKERRASLHGRSVGQLHQLRTPRRPHARSGRLPDALHLGRTESELHREGTIPNRRDRRCLAM